MCPQLGGIVSAAVGLVVAVLWGRGGEREVNLGKEPNYTSLLVHVKKTACFVCENTPEALLQALCKARVSWEHKAVPCTEQVPLSPLSSVLGSVCSRCLPGGNAQACFLEHQPLLSCGFSSPRLLTSQSCFLWPALEYA